MKKTFIISLALAGSLATSCDFLNVDDYFEDTFSEEKIFESQYNIERYFNGAVNELPKEGRMYYWCSEPGATGSDEAVSCGTFYNGILDVSFPGTELTTDKISYTSTGGWDWDFNVWPKCYKVIRKINTMLPHIDDVPDMNAFDKMEFRARCRFLRAYAYYRILQNQGPMILVGDQVYDTNATPDYYQRERSTYDECVDYIVGELDDMIDNNRLPLHFTVQADKDYGRATLAMCMGLKSRVLLLAASDQFNGNPAYANVVNTDGKHLFSTRKDPEKWNKAAQAAKDVIDLGIFDLYKEYHTDGTLDPYLSCRNVFLENWNSEVMMVRISNELKHWERSASPRQFSGYESMGATQQLVDAFRMKDGTAITPDKESGYSKANYSDPKSGWVFAPAGTRNMFVNREPRFYVNIGFNGAYWIGDQKTRIQLYYTGGSGKKGTWDFPRSGYIAIKNVSPSSNPKNGNYIKRPFVIMRYAEILLNYVEALNEYDPGNADIETYLNKIRERGGLGPVQSDLNQSQMREQIRLERRIELCFEQLRYFDTRRWLIADQTDGGPFYGMNVDAGNSFTDEAFYEKTVFETRVFRPEFYLFPIPQSEINRDPQIVQNPGW